MFETVGKLFQSASYMNWGSMLAGALLISSPIIIHLINRMRYRRIRWAAMEFLLKAQKRMRRKMIIEQLILLLLRILLVLLVGLLIARFIGFDLSGEEARQTRHLVLLDDSPSMADSFKADSGGASDAYGQGKKLITDQIVPAAAQANTPQFLSIMLLSDTGNPIAFNERLNEKSSEEVKDRLSKQELSTVRVPLHLGILGAKAQLEKEGQISETARVLHVVSDFRSDDWTEHGPAIKDALDQVRTAGIKVHLVDVTHPFRKADRKISLFHDNLAIVDLKPSKSIVARYEQVEFTLKVHNFGTSEMSGKRFVIKVNGDENKGISIVFKTLLPGQTHSETFMITPDRVATPDKPFERFTLVTAALAEEENGGLQADNVRHAVIEVRDRLPILVIDGNPDLRDKREGNSLYLQRYFTGAGGGYQWVPGELRDLEKPDLARYAFVLILNVPSIPEAAAAGLENYLKDGGGAAFFTGPGIKPTDYNKFLYRDGAGCFPVPLPESPSKELTEDELNDKRFSSSGKKILLRDPSARQHPALIGLYTDQRGQKIKDAEELERYFLFITIKRYWPVKRPGKWTNDPSVRELYCMPNEDPMRDYEAQAINLAKLIEVPGIDPNKKDDPLPNALASLKTAIPTVARSSKPLSELAVLLDRLLADQQTGGEADNMALREYWSRPENADLRTQAARLRDMVKFGDPLYFAKEFGKGRVAVILTSAGEAWNNWASEKPGNVSFPPIMKEMSTYLSSGGIDEGSNCGAVVTASFNAAEFRPEYRSAFTTHIHDPRGGRGPQGGIDPAPISPPVNGIMTAMKLPAEDNKAGPREQLVMQQTNTARPGVHMFEYKQLVPAANPADQPTETLVYRATAINLDAVREGNLQRVSTDDVARFAPKVPFHSPEDTDWVESLKNKKTDNSELGYIFAILFLLLVLEQAMSVRLSYHSSADTLAEAAPSAASAMRTRMTAPAP